MVQLTHERKDDISSVETYSYLSWRPKELKYSRLPHALTENHRLTGISSSLLFHIPARIPAIGEEKFLHR